MARRVLPEISAVASLLIAICVVPAKGLAQTEPTAPPTTAPPTTAPPTPAAAPSGAAPAGPIAATIDDAPVFVKEVEVMTRKLVKQGGPQTPGSPKTQADMLKQVIDRRLATRALERDGGYFTEDEIKKELDKLTTQAKVSNVTIEELAAREGISVDTFRNEIIWQVGWQRYVDRNLTDEMEGYFKAHQKDFDGTQVRASHILLRPDRWRESYLALVKRAEKIREQIESKQLTFEQAAEQYSSGPSRAQGGDLGFFPRHGVMVEEFAKAAYALDKDQISQPVTTTFGVHLIRVTDVKPGNKQWTQVLDQMRMPASLDLFEKLAEKEASKARIEFTGAVPYFKPGTNELVVPPAAAK